MLHEPDPNTGRAINVAEARSIEIQADRLGRLLNEFSHLDRSYQLDLSQTGIKWLMAAMAKRPRREACKALFSAKVDYLYVGTNDAAETMNEADCQSIDVGSSATIQHHTPTTQNAIEESIAELQRQSEDSLLRKTGQTLFLFATQYDIHTPPYLLAEIVTNSWAAAMALDAVDRNVALPTATTVEAMLNLTRSVVQAIEHVNEKVRNGVLVVHNGEIVDPSTRG
jgi:hypothetical protein